MIDEKTASARLMTIRIIFFAMIAALAVYLGVGWFLVTTGEPAAPEAPVFVKYVLAAVGVLTALWSHGIMLLLRGPNRIQAIAAGLGEPADPRATGLYGPELGLLVSSTIVGLALCESAAIMGLVIAIIFHDLAFLAGLTAVAVLAMIPHYPTAAKLQALNKAVNDRLMMDGQRRG